MSAKRLLSGTKKNVFEIIQKQSEKRPLSIRQIMIKSGTNSNSSIQNAIKFLLSVQMITREKVGNQYRYFSNDD
jgi:predicted transcriptional regulator